MLDWVKEHPYLAGSTVLGLLLLWWIYRNRSGGASSASSAGTVDTSGYDALAAANLQAGETLQLANLQAGVAAQGTDIQGQVALAQIAASENVADTQTAAGLELGIAQAGVPLALAGATEQITPTAGGGLIFGSSGFYSQTATTQGAQQQIINTAVASTTPASVTAGALSPYGYTSGYVAPPVQGLQLCNQSTVGGQYACSSQNIALMAAQGYNGPVNAPPGSNDSPGVCSAIHPGACPGGVYVI